MYITFFDNNLRAVFANLDTNARSIFTFIPDDDILRIFFNEFDGCHSTVEFASKSIEITSNSIEFYVAQS